jgi:hypothetical protein
LSMAVRVTIALEKVMHPVRLRKAQEEQKQRGYSQREATAQS